MCIRCNQSLVLFHSNHNVISVRMTANGNAKGRKKRTKRQSQLPMPYAYSVHFHFVFSYERYETYGDTHTNPLHERPMRLVRSRKFSLIMSNEVKTETEKIRSHTHTLLTLDFVQFTHAFVHTETHKSFRRFQFLFKWNEWVCTGLAILLFKLWNSIFQFESKRSECPRTTKQTNRTHTTRND